MQDRFLASEQARQAKYDYQVAIGNKKALMH